MSGGGGVIHMSGWGGGGNSLILVIHNAIDMELCMTTIEHLDFFLFPLLNWIDFIISVNDTEFIGLNSYLTPSTILLYSHFVFFGNLTFNL